MKIGIYGGAFDPPHIGHVRAAKQATAFLGLDRLYIVPAFTAPLKNGPAATPGQRLEMCRLAFISDTDNESENEKIIISDYEILKGGISYTKDTIGYFAGMFPGGELFLIIGDDQLAQLDRWREPEYIFANARIAVVPRHGDITNGAEYEKYRLLGADITKVDIGVTEVSSTEIRNGGKSGYLDNKVKEYIDLHGIYK